MKIKEISYGIAYQVTDGDGNKSIEVNKHLKEEPELYDEVMKHEMEHYNSKNQWLDFWIDFKSMFNTKFCMRRTMFLMKHPSTLMCYSPLLIDRDEAGKLVFGINLFALIFDVVFIATIIFLVLLFK